MKLLNTLDSIFLLPPGDDVKSEMHLSTHHVVPEGREKCILIYCGGRNTLGSHCLTRLGDYFDPGATECIKIFSLKGVEIDDVKGRLPHLLCHRHNKGNSSTNQAPLIQLLSMVLCADDLAVETQCFAGHFLVISSHKLVVALVRVRHI